MPRLSFVGAPFEHDVFVSYAHAERETDETLLRDWSQKLAGRLRALLASALNPTVDGGLAVRHVPRRPRLQAGDDLTATLREHAERSAILLVLMSPLYPKKSWCLDELRLVPRPGRQGRPRPRALPAGAHPAARRCRLAQRLKDERGALPVYLDLADAETGLPLDDLDAPAAKDVVRKALMQIKGRLEELRKRLRPAGHWSAHASLDRQIIYLHAHPEDHEAWNTAVALLDDAAAVYPSTCPTLRRTMPCCSASARRVSRSCASVPPC